MCLICGCGRPNDDHGDQRNITMDDINEAAQAAGTTRDRVLQNIMQGSQPGSSSNRQGQQAGNTQLQSSQNNDDQSQAQQNKDAQMQDRPGTYEPTLGHESGTAWGRDQEQLNYQPPEQQKHTS